MLLLTFQIFRTHCEASGLFCRGPGIGNYKSAMATFPSSLKLSKDLCEMIDTQLLNHGLTKKNEIITESLIFLMKKYEIDTEDLIEIKNKNMNDRIVSSTNRIVSSTKILLKWTTNAWFQIPKN